MSAIVKRDASDITKAILKELRTLEAEGTRVMLLEGPGEVAVTLKVEGVGEVRIDLTGGKVYPLPQGGINYSFSDEILAPLRSGLKQAVQEILGEHLRQHKITVTQSSQPNYSVLFQLPEDDRRALHVLMQALQQLPFNSTQEVVNLEQAGALIRIIRAVQTAAMAATTSTSEPPHKKQRKE